MSAHHSFPMRPLCLLYTSDAADFAEEGATPYRGTPEEFGKVLEKERETWRRVVEDGNLYTN